MAISQVWLTSMAAWLPEAGRGGNKSAATSDQCDKFAWGSLYEQVMKVMIQRQRLIDIIVCDVGSNAVAPGLQSSRTSPTE